MKKQWISGNSNRCTGVVAVFAGLFLWAGVVAADDAASLVNATGVYTLVNLHPDQENDRLYSVNYQLPGLIPVCSEVKITKLSKKKMIFTLVSSGREYQYLWHKKANRGGLNENIALFFGKDCPADEIPTLSEIDQKGIKKGIAYEGMSRRGILIAMGYPPPHVTPDLDMDTWMFWMNKFNRTAIDFGEDGLVEEIRN